MWGCPKIFAGGDSHGSSWLSSSLWRSSFSWWWKVLVRGWPWTAEEHSTPGDQP
ncbi:hypothetical protein KURONO_1773 [Mycobacterium tuberculosis str. Kurono]|nr:hypothetical protein KURONO_1773 [Mycobacterium tuberculosis str. Kurono]